VTSFALLLVLGSLAALLGVAFGAFGAHALRARLSPEALGWWKTAVDYQMYHALAVIATGLALLHLRESVLLPWAGGAFLAGIVLFSGSLYVLALTDERWLGMVTPIGGLAFLAGWALLVVEFARKL
jgi:uncharacterized membrane protein YgdD (TMEM256/DUF423 family)